MQRLKIKDLILLANKLIEKVPDPRNTKEHCESFLRKKNKKSVRQSKIITYQPKHFGTVDIKSDIREHPKTSYKLSKTIRKGEKVSSNSYFRSGKNFLNEKNVKMLLKAMQVFTMLKF